MKTLLLRRAFGRLTQAEAHELAGASARDGVASSPPCRGTAGCSFLDEPRTCSARAGFALDRAGPCCPGGDRTSGPDADSHQESQTRLWCTWRALGTTGAVGADDLQELTGMQPAVVLA